MLNCIMLFTYVRNVDLGVTIVSIKDFEYIGDYIDTPMIL